MKDRKEILMDAIGKVNEKYIENSMSKDKAPSLLIDDYITSQSGNAYEVKPVPMPEKRKFPVKTAVFTRSPPERPSSKRRIPPRASTTF